MIKPFIASGTNALLLIILGSWGYFSSQTPSFTALIPVFFGLVLLVFVSGLKKENKTIAHIVVVLTVLVLIGLIKPLMGSISRNDSAATVRVIVMMLSSVFALITFVQSFIAARK